MKLKTTLKNSLKKPDDPKVAPLRGNRGFAVLLILLGLMIVGGIVVLKAFNANSGKLARQQVDTDVLARAKLALLMRAIYDEAEGWRPGNLLIPDYLDGTAIGYDGVSGNGCQNFASPNGLPLIQGTNPTVRVDMRCIGRLPWKTLGMDVSLNKDFSQLSNRHDDLGEVPWYAVSANLNDPNCFTVLNSATLNAPAPAQAPAPGALCNSTNPVHPWLTVHDESGKILSSQVAAVLILPGVALAGQARPSSPEPPLPPRPAVGTAQYLDAMTVTDVTGCASLPGAPAAPCVIDNAARTNHFVLGNASATFNDRLLYITVQELTEQVQKRVAAQVRGSIKEYVAVTGKIPWLNALPSGFASANTSIGLLPHMAKADIYAPTEFRWEIETGLLPMAEVGDGECLKLSGTPDTYIRNVLFESIKNPPIPPASLPTRLNSRSGDTGTVGSANAGLCKWKDGPLTADRTRFDCTYTQTTNVLENLDTFSTSGHCTVNSNVLATRQFNLKRDITITVDITNGGNCVDANFSSTVQAPSASDVGRVAATCALFDAKDAILIKHTYTDIASARTASAQVRPKANPKVKFTVSNIRFSPYVPDWFADNGWDTMSIVAIANAAAPAPPTPDPCAGAATLSVGSTTGVNAVAVIAGMPLSGQTQPSTTISNYIEGMTADCKFNAQSKQHSATYNDTVLTILP